jgi:hypothetical protein
MNKKKKKELSTPQSKRFVFVPMLVVTIVVMMISAVLVVIGVFHSVVVIGDSEGFHAVVVFTSLVITADE